jgi:hypothetical protein
MRIIGNAGKAREVQAVASGVLSTGDTVVVNADGTVSVVAGASEGVNSPVVFESDSTSYPSVVYDSNTGKVVIAYREANANALAIVGTISGSSISFGTPVAFDADAVFIVSTFDSNSNKVVFAYADADNSNYGTAVVGTVSGTSISFGTPTVYASVISYYNAIAFDSNLNKVVVSYSNYTSSIRGDSVVGTVSGTSISFGGVVTFNSGNSYMTAATYDENAQKIVIAWRDTSNSSASTAIVGTVSGTTISYGTKVVASTSYGDNFFLVYDSSSQKVVLVFRDRDTFSEARVVSAIVGTVSGTSISFGSAVNASGTRGDYSSATYDPTSGNVVIAYNDQPTATAKVVAGKVSGDSITFTDPIDLDSGDSTNVVALRADNSGHVVVAFADGGSSNAGTAVIYQGDSTNADNYIGTAASGAPDGKAAKINIKGAVDENQSGLTAGQSYYVQADGTLGTTPADPSVFAGTAVAATKLIVKG